MDIDDVLTFINEAIVNNADIEVEDDTIYINYKKQSVHFSLFENNILFSPLDFPSQTVKFYPGEEGILRFKCILLTAKRYSENKTFDYFHNFFKNKDKKLTDINDLYDGD